MRDINVVLGWIELQLTKDCLEFNIDISIYCLYILNKHLTV